MNTSAKDAVMQVCEQYFRERMEKDLQDVLRGAGASMGPGGGEKFSARPLPDRARPLRTINRNTDEDSRMTPQTEARLIALIADELADTPDGVTVH